MDIDKSLLGRPAQDNPEIVPEDISSVEAAAILERLQPMIANLSSRLASGVPDEREDFQQEGTLAVLTALGRFDSTKGKAERYAARYAKGWLLNRRRWFVSRRREVTVGLFGEFPLDGVRGRARLEAMRRSGDQLGADRHLSRIDSERVRELAVRTLTARELLMIELVYFEGLQLKEAAVRMRISAPRASQLIAAGLSKLRQRLGLVS
jgi:RNA polymerase sigma factor (sigma-70 family)